MIKKLKSASQALFKTICFFTTLLIIFQPAMVYPLLAQEATLSAESVVSETPNPTPAPTDQPAETPTPQPSEPTITPEPSPSVTPILEPIPSPTVEPTITSEASPVLTPSPSPSIESLPTDQVESSSTSEPTVGQPNAPPEIPVPSDAPTPSPSPTITPVPNIQGHLAATIVESSALNSLNLDLNPANTNTSASLTTDKPDYAPTEMVIISGTDFLPNTTYTLRIASSDPPPVDFQAEVTTNDKGTFIYSYQLDGNYRPNYLVEAKDSSGNIVATVTFTDSPAPSNTKLYQWETIPSGNWITGALNSSNSNYLEGETVPFELDLGKISTSGNPYTFSICRDYQSGSHFGYISLQLFNTSRAAVPDGAISTTNNPFSGSNISSINFTEVGGQGACSSGQRETQLSINVTSESVNTYLLWGGRLASPSDLGVGAGNGSSSYPGGSLHMHLLSPNKDVGIQTNAIIQLAQITVTKVVDSGSANTNQWCFNISPDPNGQSGTICGPSGIFTGLPTGSYTITESSVSGYSFASGIGTNCTFSGSTATASVTAATTAVNASCTFHNTLSQGTLRVIKSVTNNSGGTAVPGNFNLHVKSGGVDVSGSPAAGSVTGTVYTLPVGTYAVSEDAPPAGYTQTGFSGDCDSQGSITVVAGVEKTCTITNDDQQGTLIVKKIIVNDNGGVKTASDFSFSVNSATAVNFEADGQNDLTVNAGTYNIVEPAVSGYDTTYDNCSNVQIPNGGSATCTITNNDKVAHLVVIKHVVNNNGGTASASAFTMTINNVVTSGGNSFAGNEGGVNKTLTSVGFYSVIETGLSGYAQSDSADCSGTIALGETKTCTITNDDIAPSLTLNKITNYTHGGTAPESSWTLTASGPTSISGPGAAGSADVVSDGTFSAGTYTLSESTAPTGYTNGTSYSCVKNESAPVSGNSIILAIGDTAVCSITNTDVQAKLTVTKIVNNHGGSKVISDFPLFVGATGVTSGVQNGFDAGSYTVSETGDSNYTETITGDCAANGNVMLAVGDVKSCTITNEEKPAKLVVTKVVVNDNGGTASESAFPLFVDQTGVTSGAMNTFNSGSYIVSETNQPGYSGTVSGDCDANGNVILVPGQTKSCTITNDDQPGRISGKKFNDIDGDHLYTDGTTDPNLSGWTITLDKQNDINPPVCTSGTIVGELCVEMTNSFGNYAFYGLEPGTYIVSEVLQNGWFQTRPEANGTYILTIGLGDDIDGRDFGNQGRGTIKINKIVNPADDSQWDFRVTGSVGGYDQSRTLGNGGTSTLTNVPAANYTITEVTSSAYTTTIDCGSNGSVTNNAIDFTVDPGENVECTFTNTRNTGVIIVHKAVDQGNGYQEDDVEANRLGFRWILDGGSEYEMGASASAATSDNHDINENSIPGYQFTGWYETGNEQFSCAEPESTSLPVSLTVTKNQTRGITLCNQLKNPVLTITKSNDKTGVDLTAGSSVLYTITVEATQAAASNVVVKDLLPDGFKYRGGSWAVNSSTRGNITSLIIEPVYASPGTWSLGDMAKDEKITLTLTADIDGSKQPGLYKDLAWAKGESFASTQVLANAEDPGFVDSNFVGTEVNIVKNPDGTAANIENEELRGEVLGASIALPSTGANALWIILAILLLVGGSGSIVLGRTLRRENG
ncbi:MAG: hypothetical protein PHE48_02575 [Candidatus Daviesbacteria bacterium]|nr:hypothetical protein [Candidatus Daviesbacteria bacterium]